jgi:3'-5' exoribonuclease
MVWDGITEFMELVRPGSLVRVIGRFAVHAKYGPQISVRALRNPERGTYDVADLVDGPGRSASQMEHDLRELIATIQSPPLRELLDRILGEDAPTWEAYRAAPAAKLYHQAYVHGLLEHSLTVAQAVGAISATFPGIDRDIAVTGALLHDIGKLEAYQWDAQHIEMSDAGKLQGEIPLGYFRVRSEIERIDDFPPRLAEAIVHIVLSHHGSLAHGSPVVPCTREATLVHMIDNLGGRLGSFDRLEKELATGQAWSAFDRALGSGAYFGEPRVVPEEQEQHAAAA